MLHWATAIPFKDNFFSKDETLHDIIKSDEFQKLLGTDATTEEGQDYIAEYYEVAKDWKALKKQGKEKGTIEDAASAYDYLLKTVKCESKKDDIWMTFYEGLHQHSALILSLLSSTFNIKEHMFKNKSLNSQYFKEQQLVNFKDGVSQPHERLNEIFSKTRNALMITKTFHAKGMVPKPVTKGNESTIPDFMKKIIKYIELISDNNKTSADNSISSLLSKVFRKSLQRSKPEDRNHKPGHASDEHYATIGAVIGPKRLESRARVNWNCNHKFQTIVQIKKQVHKANMKTYHNDKYKAYGWCSLLASNEWDTYIKDPLHENARLAFIVKTTNKQMFPKNISPPYGIFFESMTVTVGKKEKGHRRVDQRHLNGYNMIPIIVTILHAKKKMTSYQILSLTIWTIEW
jgi:hypothetical protein